MDGLITQFDSSFSARSLAKSVIETHQPSPLDPVTKREVHPVHQPRCTACVQSQWPCHLVRLAEAVLASTEEER